MKDPRRETIGIRSKLQLSLESGLRCIGSRLRETQDAVELLVQAGGWEEIVREETILSKMRSGVLSKILSPVLLLSPLKLSLEIIS